MLDMVEYIQKVRQELLVFIILVSIVSSTGAVYWSSNIVTNSSSWSIYRQNENIGFDLSSSVEGKIAPIDVQGRILKPYHSYYAEVIANDVQLRERVGALEGSYRSEDKIRLRSNADNGVNVTADKPVGSDVFIIAYYEQWPASLFANRTLKYSGLQINDRDFEGNNQDFVGSNLLYNHELSKERRISMGLERMNATVLATNDSILIAELKPTKYLGYLTRTYTTGIADLSYKLAGSQYDVMKKIYPAISEGDERYYGVYNITRKIDMKSTYRNNNATDEWLPCCYGGWSGMTQLDKKGHSAKEVFGCSCYKPLSNT